jgi:uncharacterized protein YhhL (DUF1145 family)
MIALVIFSHGIGILVWSISLPDALLVHKCFTDMLCILGFGIFKIIAVSIGGFLMPTACGFSVSPCGQV